MRARAALILDYHQQNLLSTAHFMHYPLQEKTYIKPALGFTKAVKKIEKKRKKITLFQNALHARFNNQLPLPNNL